ncbi:hypothetical protein VP1G_10097 [Cytospora mali]|uniref:Uncharacterized protein n=1 Tax=Cytospora mali TaxID=578113 RepID=A0A194VG37_CYTMA|nr:hypothetical protein VP1G_10097 [Valsa mali var. pyri (nom. inval.)]
MYAILTYAAAAHPDVALMVDRFARLHRDMIISEQQQREAALETGVEPHLVHFITGPTTYCPEAPQWASPRFARREARQAQKAEKARTSRESLKDKDFTYLVRRAEEALGWTGKYDNEMKPKSTWSKAKKKQACIKKRLLLKEMSDSTRSSRTVVVSIEVTYGTKRNALVAVMEISHAVLVDKTEIGMRLRENWFAGLEDTLKKAVKLLSDEELATLGKDKKWVRGFKTLMNSVPERELEGETLKGILSMVTPVPGNGGDLHNTESEKSEDEDTESSEEVGSGEELSEGQEEDEDDEDRDNEDKGGDENSGDTSNEESFEDN